MVAGSNLGCRFLTRSPPADTRRFYIGGAPAPAVEAAAETRRFRCGCLRSFRRSVKYRAAAAAAVLVEVFALQ